MGLNAAVQALKKAEPLKDKVQRCKDLLNDNDAWVCQQQLQKIYQQVLILDLEYALDRKVEQELWNLGFKNYIATLQSQAKDRKNPKRGESQALLSWCLEAASGFYLTLLQEICTAFNLDLPFRRKGYVYGCTSPWKAVEKLSVPHKSSCFYACQYCLVHLGDIARYRNESKQAELFYRHAVSLSPSSGQPYNQLALLEASRGNKLGTVFHYARSVAVKHPFPVATSNLAKTLSSALNDNSFNIDGKTKLNSQEYIAVFLKLHGVIHNLGNLKIASTYARLLTDTLTALVATESFSSWMLVQMFVINLYALDHTTDVITENSEPLRREELTADEKLARECILDLIAGSLSALLLPVYTIKNSIIDYFALPSIKLCLDWIHTKPTVLEELAFTSRLQIWPSLCVLLNALQNCVADFTYDQYIKVPLPEDRDLQGFLPLEKSFECLKFTSSLLEGDIDASNKLRAVRILRLGHRLAQYRINGSALITITLGEGNGDNRFSSIGEDTGPSNELMKELEELSLNKEKHLKMSPSPVISESIGSKGSVDPDAMENAMDKRMGILKPQGSLERNRDSVIGNTDSNILEPNVIPAARKPRQNIAMQAIMRRAENEQKQVTFRNLSPLIVDEENKEKTKIPTTSPTKTLPVGNKGVPVSGDTIKSNAACNATTMIAVQSRPPLMPFATTPTVQTQTPLFGQSSSKLTKPMQHSIAQSPQVNHQPLKEQQISAILPPISGVSQCIGSVCYQNQPFNVQNSQFAKNFSASHAGNVPSYQIQSQLPASMQAISQNVSLQHTLNQNRPLHQRVAHNVSQTSLLHQSMGISSPISQGIIPNVSKSINSQQVGNPVLPQSIAMQQQSHNMSIQPQNVGKITSKSNALPSHGQINLAAPPVTNISTLAALNTYQKNLHQAASIASSVSSVPSVPNVPSMANMPNMSNVQNGSSVTNISLNTSSVSTFPLQFSKNNFGQNTFGQITRKQLSPSIYNKTSDTLEFPFPSQGGTLKNQSQTTNAYPSFQNYDIRDFSLWKNTQQPQLSIPCWGSNSSAMQSRNQDTLPMEDYGKNWEDTSNSVNMIDRVGVGVAVGVGMGASNGYQSESQHVRHFGGANCFDDPRPLEVELKSSQPMNTGNTYSLFSSNTWGSSLQSCDTSNQEQVKTRLNQQSLWSGPGPSPLERLLEQQKSLREGGT